MVRAAAARHAEDIAIGAGALLLAGGLGWRIGWWAALTALGAIALAIGVWLGSKGGS
jgi:hypothetical protein